MNLRSIWRQIKEFYCARWYASLIIIFSILIALMLLEVKNHRFRSSDFKVYYRAAERLVNHENLYRPDIDGHYYYKYSPTAAVYFIPATIFPVAVAKVLHWIFMAIMACLGFYLALGMVRPGFRNEDPQKINNLLLLIGLILSVHVEYEFYLGQVNHILLVFYLLIIYLVHKGKNLLSALIWAGSIFIKPFGLIFLPYFLIRKKFKLVLFFIIFTAGLILAPLPFTGAANFAGQYQHWFHEISVEMNAKQSLLAPQNDTVFSILARYTPLRLINFTPSTALIFQSVILAIIGFIFLYSMSRRKDSEDNYIWEGAFLIMLIPMLSFTNHYAFQFIELTVFLIIFNFRKLTRWWQVIAVAGLVFTGINMHDIVGVTIYHFLNDISLVGVGALLLLIVLINMRLKNIA